MIDIRQGDVSRVLAALPASSFDACLCDPPYGLSFMGKQWDHGVPPAETWAAVARVLKPGAFLMAFGGTRTHHRLMCAIEDAGFELRDCLMWIHGQGFPKSLNLGNGYGTALKPSWEPIVLAMKPCDGTFAQNAQKHGVAGLNIEAGRIDPGGRWPANVILDEAAAAELDRQSGHLVSGDNPSRRTADKHRNVYKSWTGAQCLVRRGTDAGGASRFFYCAKASKAERGAGNTHPTVKPIKLCEYLAKLLPTGRARRAVAGPFQRQRQRVPGRSPSRMARDRRRRARTRLHRDRQASPGSLRTFYAAHRTRNRSRRALRRADLRRCRRRGQGLVPPMVRLGQASLKLTWWLFFLLFSWPLAAGTIYTSDGVTFTYLPPDQTAYTVPGNVFVDFPNVGLIPPFFPETPDADALPPGNPPQGIPPVVVGPATPPQTPPVTLPATAGEPATMLLVGLCLVLVFTFGGRVLHPPI